MSLQINCVLFMKNTHILSAEILGSSFLNLN
jgi:hypothetical protein